MTILYIIPEDRSRFPDFQTYAPVQYGGWGQVLGLEGGQGGGVAVLGGREGERGVQFLEEGRGRQC